jgi:hypothetical protein
MIAQTKQHKRWAWSITGGLFLAVLLTATVCCWAADITIDIDVAPNVLNLQNQGEVVTVHTDLPFSSVVGSSVSINGVEIAWWKSDNQGNFVAKFVIEEIKDLPLKIDEYNTLALTGVTINGDSFEGTAEIRVIDVIPAGKK